MIHPPYDIFLFFVQMSPPAKKGNSSSEPSKGKTPETKEEKAARLKRQQNLLEDSGMVSQFLFF